ncbi:fibroblast growth factor receptor homolog 1-like isoform X2 [Clupea harengus]|uniref:Fibroblast growth factor receptor homolog 1-like isoform X2 n=1 Tax=Clupea harengus TaxID=7950 RepID=A0A6P8FWA5_CLUHA|nr:fibroblast growth factor receptor homolog 1-like isoform X2 [Clupea harengus]
MFGFFSGSRQPHTNMSNNTSVPRNISSNTTEAKDFLLDKWHIVLISVSAFAIMTVLLMTFLWTKKYRSLIRAVQDLKLRQHLVSPHVPPADYTCTPKNITATFVKNEGPEPESGKLSIQDTKSASTSLWKPSQMVTNLNRSDLTLLQLIKAGREGVFYKAKMNRGTCKGHSMFTCKVSKESVTYKQVHREIAIMKKLGNHKNLLHLLDWDITQSPYFLVMEFVAVGTLHNFLQINRDKLSANKDLQHLFTITAYHIAHAMDHLRSKMVVHGDIALRNIMVNSFPQEVKVAEFSFARDLTRMKSRRTSRKHGDHERIPFRWYPPEYFKDKYYGFKSDVWSFGIILWEMETFGTLPYPNLNSSEDVVRHICAGHKNAEPAGCRVEICRYLISPLPD